VRNFTNLFFGYQECWACNEIWSGNNME
jgi:hypothetical protein